MAITGEHIKEFSICKLEKENQNYSDIFNYKLINTHSKHIANIDEATQKWHDLSKQVGYDMDVIGSHRQTTLEDERRRIQNMKNSSCLRAARFVVSLDGRIWADDFRNNTPIVVEQKNVLFDSTYCIKSAIACAKRIQDRLNKGWRPMNMPFTIDDLIKDLYKRY